MWYVLDDNLSLDKFCDEGIKIDIDLRKVKEDGFCEELFIIRIVLIKKKKFIF